MYESKPKFIAKALIIVVFAAIAILILVVAIKVVLERVDDNGNIKDDEECFTEEAQELMRRNGTKVPTAAKCKKKE